MDNSVQFNDPGSNIPPPAPRQAKGVTGLFIKVGLAKDEKEAQVIMLVLAICALLATALLWYVQLSNGASSTELPPGAPFAP